MFLGQKRKRKEKNEKEIGKEEKKRKEKTYRPLAVLFPHENEGRLFKTDLSKKLDRWQVFFANSPLEFLWETRF